MNQTPTLKPGAKGPAVSDLQSRLAAAGFETGAVDGDFGPGTQSAVLAFQQAHTLSADGVVGPATWAMLKAVADVSPSQDALRDRILVEAMWCFEMKHAGGEIHYQQKRPMEGINQHCALPLHIDCSGFVTLCYKWAGAADPNGRNYDGQGYTGSLVQHLAHIPQAQAQAGDLVLWLTDAKTVHVALVLKAGADPLLLSHGAEGGPSQIRFSVSDRWFKKQQNEGPNMRAVWLTLPAATGVGPVPHLISRPLPPLDKSDPPVHIAVE